MKPVAESPVPALVLEQVPPWVRALVAQTAALAIVVVIAKSTALLGAAAVGPLPLCIAQALLAASIGWALRLAPWWVAIQLGFAPTVVLATAAHLPPGLFLAAFLVLAGLYWSTYRTQVPLYPSSPAVWEAVGRLLPRQQPLRIVDLGSGMGGLVLHLAAARSDSVVLGVELAPVPWLASALTTASDSGSEVPLSLTSATFSIPVVRLTTKGRPGRSGGLTNLDVRTARRQ